MYITTRTVLSKLDQCNETRTFWSTAPQIPPVLLLQFLQRQKVLGLYRNLLRTIREVPDPADRTYLRSWARDEFKRNKTATNPVRCLTCCTLDESHALVHLESPLLLFCLNNNLIVAMSSFSYSK